MLDELKTATSLRMTIRRVPMTLSYDKVRRLSLYLGQEGHRVTSMPDDSDELRYNLERTPAVPARRSATSPSHEAWLVGGAVDSCGSAVQAECRGTVAPVVEQGKLAAVVVEQGSLAAEVVVQKAAECRAGTLAPEGAEGGELRQGSLATAAVECEMGPSCPQKSGAPGTPVAPHRLGRRASWPGASVLPSPTGTVVTEDPLHVAPPQPQPQHSTRDVPMEPSERPESKAFRRLRPVAGIEAPEVPALPAPPQRKRLHRIASTRTTSGMDLLTTTPAGLTQHNMSEPTVLCTEPNLVQCLGHADPAPVAIPATTERIVMADESAVATALESRPTPAESTIPPIELPAKLPVETAEPLGEQSAASEVSLLKRRRSLEQEVDYAEKRPRTEAGNSPFFDPEDL